MNLLELPHNQQATITEMSVDDCYQERLRAVGIGVGNTVSKLHSSSEQSAQPVCVSTTERSVFAISRKLAANIHLRLLKII